MKLVELGDHVVVALRRKLAASMGLDGSKPQHVAVIPDRPIQISDLQANATNTGLVREPIARRQHTVLSARRDVAHGV
jgi:hypothetical protein